jgi:type VI protein secretion system component Hcp
MAWFIKIDGHDGESAEQKDHINVLSWSFGANLSVTHTGTTSAQVAGQSEIHDVTLSLVPDKSLTELWLSLCTGKPIPKAELVGMKDVQGQPKQFFKLTMEDCYITTAHLSGSGMHGSDSFDNPTVSIKFDKMKIELTEYDKKGKPAGQPKMGFRMSTHAVEP